jgi:GNAT superfamily N-acetyltransferase
MPDSSQNKPQTTIRLLEEGDRDQLFRLYEKTFGHPMGVTENERHWAWEYERGPAGAACVFVCEADGKVIGAHGNLPLRFKVGEQEVLASSSFDSMVDSDYRGMGAFTRVVRAFIGSAYERGICLSYSFPNENSLPIHVNRLGRTSIEGYTVLRRHLPRHWWRHKSNLALSARILRTLIGARLRGARVRRVEGFDERFDALWRAAREQVQVGIVRDRAYLDWRFAQKPGARHTTYVYLENGAIGGYIVLRSLVIRETAVGLVMDVLALPDREDILLALFARAFVQFIRDQVEQVRFGTMARAPTLQAVWPLFRHSVEQPLVGQVYGGVDPAFALDGANWFLSFADTDFY